MELVKALDILKPKVIIALSFDINNCVQGGFIIKGYTVFSSPKELTKMYGLEIQNLNPQILFPGDIASQTALSLAIELKT